MPERIYDAHAYIGPDYHSYFHQTESYTVEKYLSIMEECGITKAVLIPGGYEDETETHYREIRRAVKEHPDRFFGLRRVNPRHSDALAKVEEAIAEHGMKGIMLHPHWDTYLADDKRIDALFERIRALGLRVPVLMYSGDIPYTMPAQIADVAVRFPDIPVIMGHMAKTEVYQHAVASALRSPNIYLETSGCNITNIIEDAVRKVGADRVLFGSGWPGMSPHAELSKIDRLKLSQEEKEKLLWRNLDSLMSKAAYGSDKSAAEGEVSR